ncbi:MAG: hypothetical protein HOP08_06160 [Cyclobacteriaceae bacterium]|nr:hypothetical protein [Cyclobacteriaceae bacterium]
MSTTRKVAIGIGIAGGALLAAWLLTGDRKKKTKEFIVRNANGLKRTLKNKQEKVVLEDDAHYV